MNIINLTNFMHIVRLMCELQKLVCVLTEAELEFGYDYERRRNTYGLGLTKIYQTVVYGLCAELCRVAAMVVVGWGGNGILIQSK